MLKQINTTIITLIPNIPNASKMSEYRPISCCNTIYKCISKVLSLRIKQVLPNLIDESQSAFVHGRRISDNILLAQELFRDYHKAKGQARCALKVDIMKGYDSVIWDFLMEALKLMGFPPKFISWVAACVCSPYYSVCEWGFCGFFSWEEGAAARGSS